MDADDIELAAAEAFDAFNRKAGFSKVIGQHKDRNQWFGLFTFDRQWFSHQGSVKHMVARCWHEYRGACKCEAKLTFTPEMVTAYIANPHTIDSHTVDHAKFLKMEDKLRIAAAVSVAPLITGTTLRRNLMPTNPIPASLRS